MKHFLTIAIFLSISCIGFAQTKKSVLPISSQQSENFIVGIGNTDPSVFFDIITYIETTANISVDKQCETNKILSLKVLTKHYRTYDHVRDMIKIQFPNVILNRKNETILLKDCSDEILKQWLDIYFLL